ncbi:MAG TPA: MBL fold metallo-hydrolase [Thermoleophilaceae bacterium]
MRERVGDGVEVLRLRPPGRLQRLTNVYLLEDGGRVTLFDSGSVQMAGEIEAAARERGGVGRVLLSHAHADHRGGASRIDAPVLCHDAERADVEGDGGEHYFDYSKVRNPVVRTLAPGMVKRMDGGPLRVSETVSEGDRIAGFEVLHLPGHAPGQIGLWRESDRLAIVADAVFVFDPFTMGGLAGRPRLAPPAGRPDPAAARESVAKVAVLDPATVWIGHYGPLTGGDVRAQLEAVAGSD